MGLESKTFFAIGSKYIGVINSYIENELAKRGIKVVVEGDVELLFECRCCRYRTVKERGNYEVCPVCKWEDDGGYDPNAYSSVNGSSLCDARSTLDGNTILSADTRYAKK